MDYTSFSPNSWLVIEDEATPKGSLLIKFDSTKAETLNMHFGDNPRITNPVHIYLLTNHLTGISLSIK